MRRYRGNPVGASVLPAIHQITWFIAATNIIFMTGLFLMNRLVVLLCSLSVQLRPWREQLLVHFLIVWSTNSFTNAHMRVHSSSLHGETNQLQEAISHPLKFQKKILWHSLGAVIQTAVCNRINIKLTLFSPQALLIPLHILNGVIPLLILCRL